MKRKPKAIEKEAEGLRKGSRRLLRKKPKADVTSEPKGERSKRKEGGKRRKN